MKKMLSLVIVFALVMMTATTAFAKDSNADVFSVNVDEEIYNALNGITDLEVNDPSFAKAVFEKEDGTQEILQVYTTTKELDIPATLSANNTGKVYATTAVATTALSEDKSDSNLKNKYFVTAYGTIYWRDNVGPDNEFLGASGGWDRDRDPDTGFLPALSNAKVDMQGQHGAGTYVHKLFYPTTYQFNIDKSQFNYVKYSIWFDSTITVDGSNTLSLHVSTGLLT